MTAGFSESGSIAVKKVILYRLVEDSVEAVASWVDSTSSTNNGFSTGGVDRFLRVFWDATAGPASQLQLDGTIISLPNATAFSEIFFVTPNGYMAGADIRGTAIATEGGVWDPNGNFRFVEEFANIPASFSSFRDRNDGRGVNIGKGSMVIYAWGAEPQTYELDPEFFGWRTTVSQGDLVVYQRFDGQPFVFYPGIDPANPSRGLPIHEVFPDLANIAIDRVLNLYAVDRRIYMTLRTQNDQFLLFGARDPSVVAEPTCVLQALVAIAIFVPRRARSRQPAR
jgi:hypothetical protein